MLRKQSKASLRQRLEAAELAALATDAKKTSLQRAVDQAKAIVAKLHDDYTGACRARDDAQFCLRESAARASALAARVCKLEQHSEEQRRAAEAQARSLRRRRQVLRSFDACAAVALVL